MVPYIDDGVALTTSKDEGNLVSLEIRYTLLQAGFLCRHGKCEWEPAQQGQWLGFSIDLAKGVLSIPDWKIASLKCQLVALRSSMAQVVHARSLASVIGKIISMGLGIGPISRFRTRSLYALLDRRDSWSNQIFLDRRN